MRRRVFSRSDLEGIAEVRKLWQDIDLVSLPSRGFHKLQRNDDIIKIQKKKSFSLFALAAFLTFTVELRTFYIVFLNLSLGEPESPDWTWVSCDLQESADDTFFL